MAGKKGYVRLEWTKEQDDNLRAVWVTEKRIKVSMHLFGDHTYDSVIHRAFKLGLGRRPICPRGQMPVMWPLIKRELENGPDHRFALADRLGAHYATVHKALAIAHANREVHVSGWYRRKPTSAAIPVFSLGDGMNVPKPAALTKAEQWIRRKERERMRKSGLGQLISKDHNPFAVALGSIRPADTKPGRVIKQDMTIHLRDDVETA